MPAANAMISSTMPNRTMKIVPRCVNGPEPLAEAATRQGEEATRLGPFSR